MRTSWNKHLRGVSAAVFIFASAALHAEPNLMDRRVVQDGGIVYSGRLDVGVSYYIPEMLRPWRAAPGKPLVRLVKYNLSDDPVMSKHLQGGHLCFELNGPTFPDANRAKTVPMVWRGFEVFSAVAEPKFFSEEYPNEMHIAADVPLERSEVDLLWNEMSRPRVLPLELRYWVVVGGSIQTNGEIAIKVNRQRVSQVFKRVTGDSGEFATGRDEIRLFIERCVDEGAISGQLEKPLSNENVRAIFSQIRRDCLIFGFPAAALSKTSKATVREPILRLKDHFSQETFDLRLSGWVYGEDWVVQVPATLGNSSVDRLTEVVSIPKDGAAQPQRFEFSLEDGPGDIRLREIILTAEYTEPGLDRPRVFTERFVSGSVSKTWQLQVAHPSDGSLRYRLLIRQPDESNRLKTMRSDWIPVRNFGYNFSVPYFQIWLDATVRAAITSR